MNIAALAGRIKRLQILQPKSKASSIDEMLKAENRYRDYIQLILDGEDVEPIHADDSIDDTFREELESSRERFKESLMPVIGGSILFEDLKRSAGVLKGSLSYEAIMTYQHYAESVKIYDEIIKNL